MHDEDPQPYCNNLLIMHDAQEPIMLKCMLA